MSEILESRTVFIDTCIFRNHNFYLDNETFSKFRKLCQGGELEFVTTEITEKEIQKRIREHAVEAFAGLQKFRDRTHLLRRLHTQFGKAYKELSVGALEQGLNKAVKSWFSRVKAQKIQIPNDAAKQVFQKYFKQEKPFSEGKKKSEFPDAFVIQALTSLQKKVYAVSADGDYEGSSKDIIQLKSLGELIHLYNSHIDKVADFVQKLVLVKNRAMLIRWVKSELEKIPAILKDSDGEIRTGELHLLDITDAWVVSFKKSSAEVLLEFKFEISGHAREFNEAGYFVGEREYQQEQFGQAQIKVEFDLQNDSVFYPKDLRFSEELEIGIEVG